MGARGQDADGKAQEDEYACEYGGCAGHKGGGGTSGQEAVGTAAGKSHAVGRAALHEYDADEGKRDHCVNDYQNRVHNLTGTFYYLCKFIRLEARAADQHAVYAVAAHNLARVGRFDRAAVHDSRSYGRIIRH